MALHHHEGSHDREDVDAGARRRRRSSAAAGKAIAAVSDAGVDVDVCDRPLYNGIAAVAAHPDIPVQQTLPTSQGVPATSASLPTLPRGFSGSVTSSLRLPFGLASSPKEGAPLALTPHGPPAEVTGTAISMGALACSVSGASLIDDSSDDDFDVPAPANLPQKAPSAAPLVQGLNTASFKLRGRDDTGTPADTSVDATSSDMSPPKTGRRSDNDRNASDTARHVPFNATRGLASGALADSVPWPVSYVTLFLLDGLEQDIFSLFYRVIYTLEATRRAGGTALVHCQQV